MNPALFATQVQPPAPSQPPACVLPERADDSQTEHSDAEADASSKPEGGRGMDAAFAIGVAVLLVAAIKIVVQLVAGPLYGELGRAAASVLLSHSWMSHCVLWRVHPLRGGRLLACLAAGHGQSGTCVQGLQSHSKRGSSTLAWEGST